MRSQQRGGRSSSSSRPATLQERSQAGAFGKHSETRAWARRTGKSATRRSRCSPKCLLHPSQLASPFNNPERPEGLNDETGLTDGELR